MQYSVMIHFLRSYPMTSCFNHFSYFDLYLELYERVRTGLNRLLLWTQRMKSRIGVILSTVIQQGYCFVINNNYISIDLHSHHLFPETYIGLRTITYNK